MKRSAGDTLCLSNGAKSVARNSDRSSSLSCRNASRDAKLTVPEPSMSGGFPLEMRLIIFATLCSKSGISRNGCDKSTVLPFCLTRRVRCNLTNRFSGGRIGSKTRRVSAPDANAAAVQNWPDNRGHSWREVSDSADEEVDEDSAGGAGEGSADGEKEGSATGEEEEQIAAGGVEEGSGRTAEDGGVAEGGRAGGVEEGEAGAKGAETRGLLAEDDEFAAFLLLGAGIIVLVGLRAETWSEDAASAAVAATLVVQVVAAGEDVTAAGEEVVITAGEVLVAAREVVVAAGEAVVAAREVIITAGEVVVAAVGDDAVAAGEDVIAAGGDVPAAAGVAGDGERSTNIN